MNELHIKRARFARRNQRFRWYLTHANGNVLANSSEGYSDEDECIRMGQAVTGGKHKPQKVIID